MYHKSLILSAERLAEDVQALVRRLVNDSPTGRSLCALRTLPEIALELAGGASWTCVAGLTDRAGLAVEGRSLPARLRLSDPRRTASRAESWLAKKVSQQAAKRSSSLVDLLEAWTADRRGTQSSQNGCVIPCAFGEDGQQVSIELGTNSSHHALVVGQIGSGKSTLLHSIIVSSAVIYPADELQLFLIDLKSGVEFKSYAQRGLVLTSARVVAINGRAEFAISVLRSLNSEMDRRNERFRAAADETGIPTPDLATYRSGTGQPMARLLLLVDEFQVLFDGSRAQGDEAEVLLSRLVRLGCNTGIHVVLASQTIRDAARLRPIIDQMSTRVLLRATEADARSVLADEKVDLRSLVTPGSALINTETGVTGNTRPMRAAFADPASRDQLISDVCARDAAIRVPARVFDGMERPISPARDGDQPFPTVDLGEPFTLKESLQVMAVPESGSNYGVIGVRSDISRDIRRQFMIGFAAQEDAEISVIEAAKYSPDGVRQGIGGVVEELYVPVTIVGRSGVAAALESIRDEIDLREGSSRVSPPRLLVIEDIHHQRDLHPPDPYARSEETNLARLLEYVMRNGPEVGVHTVVSTDSYRRLSECLTRPAAREVGTLILQQMGRDESVSAISSDAAAQIADDSAVMFEVSTGRTESNRPVRAPKPRTVESDP